MMKDALDQQDLRPFLMIQSLGFHVPEAENLKAGYHELPEYPFCKFNYLLVKILHYQLIQYEITGVHYN